MPSWECKLTAFEGPLDLLLHLVKEAKIDLEEIFISEITDQYLEYMSGIEYLSMERASEFINMASLLIYIKSRNLLPAEDNLNSSDEEYMDPEVELLDRLRQYQLFKESVVMFKELAEQAGEYFYKLPEDWIEEDEYTFLNLDIEDIKRAFNRLIRRSLKSDAEPSVQISQDLFSIRKQKHKIEQMLQIHNTVKFNDLFSEFPSPMEVAVTLFALLELWHHGKVDLSQKKIFSQITITNNLKI